MNQKGFGLIGVLIGITVVLVASVVGVYLVKNTNLVSKSGNDNFLRINEISEEDKLIVLERKETKQVIQEEALDEITEPDDEQASEDSDSIESVDDTKSIISIQEPNQDEKDTIEEQPIEEIFVSPPLTQEPDLDEIEQYSDDSKYKGMVEIKKSTSGPKADDINKEYVVLQANLENEAVVIVSGWSIESLITNRKISIGNATRIFSGIISSETTVSLAPGEEIIISTGHSPIGVSFKTNKCIGYLEQFQDFTPRLSRQCPSPEDEFNEFSGILISPINDACFEFIDRMSRCKIPTETLPITLSQECNNFITNTINYSGCVANHRNDLDFIGNDWRVFLNRNEELWREKQETLRLLDWDGKTVDEFTY